MAYEDRGNGTHAMVCDKCHHEMLSPGKDELIEDLSLAGWTPVGAGQDGKERFVCNHCAKAQATKSPMQQMFGDDIQVQAGAPVRKGDPFHDANGNVVGHYEDDAMQGDDVTVKFDDAKPAEQPSEIETYDAMMEGTDADDDRLGRVSAVAPAGGSPVTHGRASGVAVPTEATLAEATSDPGDRPPGPQPRASAPRESGMGSVVRGASTPDIESSEAKARLQRAPTKPRGPAIDTDALLATANIFDNLDTSWDPDA